jgi:hypothetical protein
MRSLSLTAAIIMTFLGTPALADFNSGNELLRDCTATGGEPKSFICLGYLEAIADALRSSHINGWGACMSAEVSVRQLHDVVTQFLQDNAKLRHLAAAGLVAHALADAFPCR